MNGGLARRRGRPVIGDVAKSRLRPARRNEQTLVGALCAELLREKTQLNRFLAATSPAAAAAAAATTPHRVLTTSRPS